MARGTPFLIAVLSAWACLSAAGCTPSSPAQHPAPEVDKSAHDEYAASHKHDEAAFQAVVADGVPYYLLSISVWSYDDGLEPKHLAGPYKEVMIDQVRKAVPTEFQDEFDRQFPDDDTIMASLNEAEVSFIQALRRFDSLGGDYKKMMGESVEAQTQSSQLQIGSPEDTEAFIRLGRDNVFYRYFLVRHAITMRVGDWMFARQTLRPWLSRRGRADELRRHARHFLDAYPADADLSSADGRLSGSSAADALGGHVYLTVTDEQERRAIMLMASYGYYLLIFPGQG